MSTSSDQQRQLEKLRPRTVVDEVWPAPARDAAFERILQAARETGSPIVQPSRRRGRLIVAGALAAVLIPSGVGVAAAQGLLSAELADQLAWWSDETGGSVNEQNARRIAQGPGPDASTMLTVWSSPGDNGTICTSVIFETPGPLDRPADTEPDFAVGSCPTAEQQAQSGFGDLGGSTDGKAIHTMISTAGEAVRAELQFEDGSVRRTVSAGQNFAFWYRADENTPAPVLVGYNKAGKEVGRFPLPNLITNEH